MAGGHEVGVVAEVPLPDAGGGVAPFAEDLRNRPFAWVEPFPGCREKDAQVLFVDVHVDPPWVATGHQAGAGGRADRASGIEIGQAHALPGHPVEDRCGVRLRSEGTDVCIAQVVAEYDD